MTQADEQSSVRIGNFSGFYGDRHDSIGELLDAGVDYLTGDYLAELTMLILRKNQLAGRPAYAAGFLSQLEPVLARIAEQGVKLVCNAGGLDPVGCADAVRALGEQQGLSLTVAAVSGDDLLSALPSLMDGDTELLANLDSGEPFDVDTEHVLAANAYLGAWPIVAALEAGADIVICPRVTDASLVIAPAAHHHNWATDDYDRLAGALWAGHAIECGAQVTGGNYAFFHESGDLGIPPMPIAEIFADGSSLISKSIRQKGIVTVDTVTAQLLYEVGGPRYYNPDVIGDLRTVTVSQVDESAVLLSGAVGYAPTSTAKLSICFEGGYRNSVTIGLTGRHLEEKLTWLRTQIDEVLTGSDDFDSYRWTVVGPRDAERGSIDDATALAIITARSSTAQAVGRRAFSGAITQLGISSIPGLYFVGPPQQERRAAVQWPALVDKSHVAAVVHVPGRADSAIAWPVVTGDVAELVDLGEPDTPEVPDRPTVDLALGDLFGTRSGDKAGLANVGVWARDAVAYAWLRRHLTVDRFRELAPDAADLHIERHEMPGVRGLNFVLHGFLEQGTASSTRVDSQAKGLGEYLASRRVAVPVGLVRQPPVLGASTAASSDIDLSIEPASAVTG